MWSCDFSQGRKACGQRPVKPWHSSLVFLSMRMDMSAYFIVAFVATGHGLCRAAAD
jgi:hypothetical protein